MIKANELRLGNWVHFTNSNGKEMLLQMEIYLLAYLLEANPDNIQHGYGITYRKDSIKGIPITPEILEKIHLYGREGIAVKSGGWLKVTPELKWAEISSTIGTLRVSCEYIHQLQNLYFAIAQEELEIKIPATV